MTALVLELLIETVQVVLALLARVPYAQVNALNWGPPVRPIEYVMV